MTSRWPCQSKSSISSEERPLMGCSWNILDPKKPNSAVDGMKSGYKRS